MSKVTGLEGTGVTPRGKVVVPITLGPVTVMHTLYLIDNTGPCPVILGDRLLEALNATLFYPDRYLTIMGNPVKTYSDLVHRPIDEQEAQKLPPAGDACMVVPTVWAVDGRDADSIPPGTYRYVDLKLPELPSLPPEITSMMDAVLLIEPRNRDRAKEELTIQDAVVHPMDLNLENVYRTTLHNATDLVKEMPTQLETVDVSWVPRGSVSAIKAGDGGFMEQLLEEERTADMIEKLKQHVLDKAKSGYVPETCSNVKFDSMKVPPGHETYVKIALDMVSDVFAKSDDDYGCLWDFEAHIDVGEAIPIRQRPRRIPHMLRETVRKEIERMVRIGQVRQCNGGWLSPLVIVKKPDGKLRICVT
jgi:hypothetical protein